MDKDNVIHSHTHTHTHTHTQTHTDNRILISHKKEWNFAIWSKMGGLEGYYVK